MTGRRAARTPRRRWPTVGIALLALLVCAADVAVVTLRNRATPVSFEHAVERYRSQVRANAASGQAGGAAGAGSGSSLDPSTTGAPTSPSGDSSSTSATASATSTSSSSPAVDGNGPPTSAAGDARPAAGVYRYATSGGEEVPVISAKRSYPSVTTGTATRGAGCGWHFRVDLLEEHTDEYDLCTTRGGVALTGVRITIEWFLIRESVELECRPAVQLLAAGAAAPPSTSDCTGTAFGHGLDASLVVHPRPPEDLVVAGVARRAARVDWDLVFTGQFEGSGRYRTWIDPTSGLFLKVVREVDAQGQTPLGKQRYVEHSTMAILGTTPST